MDKKEFKLKTYLFTKNYLIILIYKYIMLESNFRIRIKKKTNKRN